MGVNWCDRCEGYGSGVMPRSWSEWWRGIPRRVCIGCGGDGYAKPPGWPDKKRMAKLRPSPPPPSSPRS